MSERILTLMSESLRLILVDRFHEAIIKLNHLLVLDPENILAKTLLFKIAVLTANNENVLSITEELLETDPNNIDYLFQRANSLGNMDQFDSAFELFNKVIDLDPTFYLAYACRGKIYRENKKYDLAMQDFDLAIENTKDNPSVFDERALTFFELKNYEKAILDFTESLRINKGNDIIRYFLAISLSKLGRNKQALSEVKKIKDTTLFIAYCYLERGIIYQNNKLFDKALNDFNTAIEMDDSDARFYYYRAMHHLTIREYKKALADFERVLQLECESLKLDVFIGLAHVYRQMKQFDKAIDFANQAFALDANKKEVLVTFAKIYGELGEKEKFFEHLEQAVRAGYDWKTMDKPIRKKYFPTNEFKEIVKMHYDQYYYDDVT